MIRLNNHHKRKLMSNSSPFDEGISYHTINYFIIPLVGVCGGFALKGYGGGEGGD